jgi:hypothetical protein
VYYCIIYIYIGSEQKSSESKVGRFVGKSGKSAMKKAGKGNKDKEIDRNKMDGDVHTDDSEIDKIKKKRKKFVVYTDIRATSSSTTSSQPSSSSCIECSSSKEYSSSKEIASPSSSSTNLIIIDNSTVESLDLAVQSGF